MAAWHIFTSMNTWKNKATQIKTTPFWKSCQTAGTAPKPKIMRLHSVTSHWGKTGLTPPTAHLTCQTSALLGQDSKLTVVKSKGMFFKIWVSSSQLNCVHCRFWGGLFLLSIRELKTTVDQQNDNTNLWSLLQPWKLPQVWCSNMHSLPGCTGIGKSHTILWAYNVTQIVLFSKPSKGRSLLVCSSYGWSDINFHQHNVACCRAMWPTLYLQFVMIAACWH